MDQGYVLENGVIKARYGGAQITESMQRMMSEHGHRFFSPVEAYISRYVKEKVAFVAPVFEEAVDAEQHGTLEPGVVDARRFHVPDGTKSFSVGGARFRSTEGLFQPLTHWGMDTLGLPELVHKAVQAASIDMRKTLCRNIYLSGGTSLLPGLPERLERELQFLVPASSMVTVHAGEHRQHAAFRGASVLAHLGNFDNMCVWQDDWHEIGAQVITKWKDDVAADYRDQWDSDDEEDEAKRHCNIMFARESDSEEQNDENDGCTDEGDED